MARIAVVGRDWLPRVLIRAQLEEDGHEVDGYETLDNVIVPLRIGLLPLDLLILDTTGQRLDREQLASLRQIAGATPVLIVTGPFDASQTDFAALGFPDVLVRPVLVRAVVERANELLGIDRPADR